MKRNGKRELIDVNLLRFFHIIRLTMNSKYSDLVRKNLTLATIILLQTAKYW